MAELNGDTAAVQIDTRVDQTGDAFIALSGELDSSNAATLEATLASLTAARPGRLVFDLTGLRFMDSAGIAVLVGAATRVGAVELLHPSPVVRRVIEITGLSQLLGLES
jgi:anti-sigma B factor antagonist